MDERLHIGRQFGVEKHLLSGYGVDKSQCLGVQCLTRACLKAVLDELTVLAVSGPFQDLVASVTLVTEKRVSDMFHVNPYLMRAACKQIDGKIKYIYDNGTCINIVFNESESF